MSTEDWRVTGPMFLSNVELSASVPASWLSREEIETIQQPVLEALTRALEEGADLLSFKTIQPSGGSLTVVDLASIGSFYSVSRYPQLLRIILNAFLEFLRRTNPQVICGIERDGTPWAGAVGLALEKPVVRVDTKTKDIPQNIAGQHIVPIDMGITSGKSMREAISLIREAHGIVRFAVVVGAHDKALPPFAEMGIQVLRACPADLLAPAITKVVAKRR